MEVTDGGFKRWFLHGSQASKKDLSMAALLKGRWSTHHLRLPPSPEGVHKGLSETLGSRPQSENWLLLSGQLMGSPPEL